MYIGKKLLRRPRPEKDESLAGYIIRLTESNYYPSPNWIFQMSSLNKRGIHTNVFYPYKDDLQKLSLLSEVEEEILWSMAWTSNQQKHNINTNTIKIFGFLVPIRTLSPQKVKLCAVCLSSAPYCRAVWDLSLISACPLHHCLLIHYCPQCSKEIKWSRAKVTICNCGFDWRNYKPEILSMERVLLSKHIYNLCCIPGHDLEKINYDKTTNPVLELNLQDFVHLLYSLIRFGDIYHIKEKFHHRAKVIFGERESDYFFDMAFFVALNWRSEFKTFIPSHKISLEPEYRALFIQRPTQYFLELFKFIFNCFSLKSCSFITRVIEDYLWELLLDMSIKNLQISGIKQQHFYSFRSPLKQGKNFLKKLAIDLELKDLTIAGLFTRSTVEIYDETIFFKMIYLDALCDYTFLKYDS